MIKGGVRAEGGGRKAEDGGRGRGEIKIMINITIMGRDRGFEV